MAKEKLEVLTQEPVTDALVDFNQGSQDAKEELNTPANTVLTQAVSSGSEYTLANGTVVTHY
jgi:hypothetical protein